jgi:hypothetical protein
VTRPGPRGRLRQRTRARTPALAGPALAQEEPGGEGRGRRHRVPPGQISIQLFTLRDQLAIDLEGTLQALHQIGYTRVEHAGFVGRTAEEFKAALDAAGLWASSGHVPIPQPYDVLTDATDPELVHLEMDLFWVTRGARDPVDLIPSTRAGFCSSTSRT